MTMAQDDTTVYYALIEHIIADQRDVWGDLAIDIANSVPGLVVAETVTESGDIWVNGEERKIANALAESYIDRFGRSAALSLRAIADEYEDDIELPPVLAD